MSERLPRLLVIAPHPDDEILGPGGTIARFSQAGGEVTVLTVTADLPPLYPEGMYERELAEARLAQGIVGVKESIYLGKPAVLLEQVSVPELNEEILAVVRQVEPDVVLVPYYDRHVDHRRVFEAAMVACRPVGPGREITMLAAYETISETHWNAPHLEPNFTPNWYVDVTEHIEAKLEAMACYETQLQAFPSARSLEALRALALLRGSQVGLGFAEGFQVVRMSALPEVLARGV